MVMACPSCHGTSCKSPVGLMEDHTQIRGARDPSARRATDDSVALVARRSARLLNARRTACQEGLHACESICARGASRSPLHGSLRKRPLPAAKRSMGRLSPRISRDGAVARVRRTSAMPSRSPDASASMLSSRWGSAMAASARHARLPLGPMGPHKAAPAPAALGSSSRIT